MNTGLVLAWLIIGWTVIDTIWKALDKPVKVPKNVMKVSPFYVFAVVVVGLLSIALAIATIL